MGEKGQGIRKKKEPQDTDDSVVITEGKGRGR